MSYTPVPTTIPKLVEEAAEKEKKRRATHSGGCWGNVVDVAIQCGLQDLMYVSCISTFGFPARNSFMSSLETVGSENLPKNGPCIFAATHRNQHFDGVTSTMTNFMIYGKKMGLLVAEETFKGSIIGKVAEAIGSVPVKRPQDVAKPGEGEITFDDCVCKGRGTSFNQLSKGWDIRAGRRADFYKIKEIISDTEMLLVQDIGRSDPAQATEFQGQWTTYDIIEPVDQSEMFNAVYDALERGQSILIFPEGSSTDKPDLLPLKIGIALVAFGMANKRKIKIPVIPLGFTYRNHGDWRFKTIVEYGKPLIPTDEELKRYQDRNEKKKVLQEFLTAVENGIRSVFATASHVEILRLAHTARRLYQDCDVRKVPTKRNHDLHKRFVLGYSELHKRFMGDVPNECKEMEENLQAYQNDLDALGIRDYQVEQTASVRGFSVLKVVAHVIKAIVYFMLGVIPLIFINGPIGLVGERYARVMQKRYLKHSRVKLKALDTLTTHRWLAAIPLYALVCVSYPILLAWFSPIPARFCFLLFFLMPFIQFGGVYAIAEVFRNVRELRPVYIRMNPASRRKVEAIAGQRRKLKEELRRLMKEYGPGLGGLYDNKSDEWYEEYERDSKGLGRTLSRMNSADSMKGSLLV